MNTRVKWTLVGLTAAVLLMANPYSRAAILWILPLGSGVDDLVFLVLLVTVGLIAFIQGWISLPQLWDRHRD